MLSIVSIPSDISMSRNPIIYYFSNKDIFGNAIIDKRKGVIVEISSTFEIGQTFTVQFEINQVSTEVTFTFVAAWTNTNHLLTIWNLSQIANRIRVHHLISPYLNVYVIQNKIVIEFLENGNFLDVIISHNNNVSNILPQEENINDEYKSTYEIILEHHYSYENWYKIYEGEIYLNTKGYVQRLNIARILHSAIAKTLSWSNSYPTINTNIRKFYVKFKNGFSTINTDIKKVAFGGFEKYDYYFFDSLNSTNSLLTNKKKIKAIPNVMCLLSCYIRETQNVSVEIQEYFKNTLVNVHNTTSIRVEAKNYVTFNIVSSIAIDPLSTHLIVTFKGAGIPISQSITVEIIKRSSNTKVIAYLNAYSCWETLILEGEQTELITIKSENYQSSDSMFVERIHRQVQDFDRSYIYRSSVLSEAERAQIVEVDLSPMILDITNPQRPIELTIIDSNTKEEKIKETSDTTYIKEWKMTKKQKYNF